MVGLCDLLFLVFGFINLVGLTEYHVTCGYHACMYMISHHVFRFFYSIPHSSFNILLKYFLTKNFKPLKILIFFS